MRDLVIEKPVIATEILLRAPAREYQGGYASLSAKESINSSVTDMNVGVLVPRGNPNPMVLSSPDFKSRAPARNDSSIAMPQQRSYGCLQL